MKQVPVYLDGEEEQKTLFTHLRSLLARTQSTVEYTDEVQFICEVLFPEVSITVCMLQNFQSWNKWYVNCEVHVCIDLNQFNCLKFCLGHHIWHLCSEFHFMGGGRAGLPDRAGGPSKVRGEK